MPTELGQRTKVSEPSSVQTKDGARVVAGAAWTGLAFAAVQSICTVLIGLGGARLLVGLLGLASASSVFVGLNKVHADWLRIPMILFSILASVANLVVVAQVRYLRNRPASRWRLNLESLPGKIRQERWQLLVSGVSLVLVVAEEILHLHQHGHL